MKNLKFQKKFQKITQKIFKIFRKILRKSCENVKKNLSKILGTLKKIMRKHNTPNHLDIENTLMDSPNLNPLKRPLSSTESTFTLARGQDSNTHPDEELSTIDLKKQENEKNRSQTRQKNPQRMTPPITPMHPQLYLQKINRRTSKQIYRKNTMKNNTASISQILCLFRSR